MDDNKGLSPSSELSKEFKIERYKFILQQLNSLNEGTHKFLTLFQTLATAILGVGIAIFAAWRELKVTAETARLGINAVLGLFTILSLFVLLSIVINAISWYDYRNEEVELLAEESGKSFREKPSWHNFWRWHETYFFVFLLSTLIAVVIFAKYWLLPTIV